MQRKYAKRTARRIYTHMDKSMDYLLQLAEAFEKDHPLEAEALRANARMELESQKMLTTFCEHVWGKVPARWNGKEDFDGSHTVAE